MKSSKTRNPAVRPRSTPAPGLRPSGRLIQGDLGALRCECGRLLARILDATVELKCTRCKRVVLIVAGRDFAEVVSAGRPCRKSLRHERDG